MSSFIQSLSEAEIQMQVVEYLDLLMNQKKILWFSASGNGQFQKSPKVRAKMWREGVRPGMPDLTIAGRGWIVFIELKTKAGRLTDHQELAIEALAGHVCRSLEEVQAVLKKYISR